MTDPITLNCIILTTHPRLNSVFTIHANLTDQLLSLRKRIYTKHPRGLVDERSLVLYKPTQPLALSLDLNLNLNLDSENGGECDTTLGLSALASNKPEAWARLEILTLSSTVGETGLGEPVGGYLHLILRRREVPSLSAYCPSEDEDEDERKDEALHPHQVMFDRYQNILSGGTSNPAVNPPTQQTIHPPIQIFNPIFGTFVHLHTHPLSHTHPNPHPYTHAYDPAAGSQWQEHFEPTTKDLISVKHLLSYLPTVQFDNPYNDHVHICARLLRGIVQPQPRVDPNRAPDSDSGSNSTTSEELNWEWETDVDESEPDTVVLICNLRISSCRVPVLITRFTGTRHFAEGDPSIRVGETYRRVWIASDREAAREKTCCPTLLLNINITPTAAAATGGSAYLTTFGAVLTDRLIIQNLTDTIWLGMLTTEEDARVYRVARILVALRMSIGMLGGFYRRVCNTSGAGAPVIPPLERGTPHPRFFPHAESFSISVSPDSDPDSECVFRFRYIRPLVEDGMDSAFAGGCVTYLAEILDDDDDDERESGGGTTTKVEAETGTKPRGKIVVKFVSRYGVEAHRFLAELGHAPRLWYYGPIPSNMEPESESKVQSPVGQGQAPAGLALGPFRMVVMDYIDIRTQTKPPKDARQQVGDVLRKLHIGGYVFGDLREGNILFDASAGGNGGDDVSVGAGGTVKLIDFNWCGRYDPTTRDGDEGLPDGLQDEIDEALKLRSIAVNGGVDDADADADGRSRSYAYARYPLSLSTTIAWPKGVAPLEQIRPIYDWRMFEKLEFK